MPKPLPTPIKSATHLSKVLGWRNNPTRDNFAYGHEAQIVHNPAKDTWEVTSFLNGEKVRVEPIYRGDIIWQANSERVYLSVLNKAFTFESLSISSADYGSWSIWDGEKLIESTKVLCMKGFDAKARLRSKSDRPKTRVKAV